MDESDESQESPQSSELTTSPQSSPQSSLELMMDEESSQLSQEIELEDGREIWYPLGIASWQAWKAELTDSGEVRSFQLLPWTMTELEPISFPRKPRSPVESSPSESQRLVICEAIELSKLTWRSET